MRSILVYEVSGIDLHTTYKVFTVHKLMACALLMHIRDRSQDNTIGDLPIFCL